MKIILSGDRIMELTEQDIKDIRKMFLDNITKTQLVITVDIASQLDKLYNLLIVDKSMTAYQRNKYHEQIMKILEGATAK